MCITALAKKACSFLKLPGEMRPSNHPVHRELIGHLQKIPARFLQLGTILYAQRICHLKAESDLLTVISIHKQPYPVTNSWFYPKITKTILVFTELEQPTLRKLLPRDSLGEKCCPRLKKGRKPPLRLSLKLVHVCVTSVVMCYLILHRRSYAR